MNILSGTVARSALATELASRFAAYSPKPALAIIMVGNDPASALYVKNKKKFGESVGAAVSLLQFDENVQSSELIKTIEQLNSDEAIHGIIVQSPLPSHLSFDEITSHVIPIKDVDGLVSGSPHTPATARGVMSLLDFYNIDVTNKKAVVIGRSKMVGAPIARELTKRGAIVTVCHSQTPDLSVETKKAEIIVVAMGKPEYINASHVSPGQIVIDVGIHKKGEMFVGDVDRHSVESIIDALSPVPGGVGPMTVCAVFQNLEDAYTHRNK